VDRLPADSGLSYAVQQDQRLAGSGSMLGELVGGGRRQAERDDVSSSWGNGFKAPSAVQLRPRAALFLGRVSASVEKEDGRRFLNELPTHQEAHARARTSITR